MPIKSGNPDLWKTEDAEFHSVGILEGLPGICKLITCLGC